MQDLRRLHRTRPGTHKLRGLAASGKVGTAALWPQNLSTGHLATLNHHELLRSTCIVKQRISASTARAKPDVMLAVFACLQRRLLKLPSLSSPDFSLNYDLKQMADAITTGANMHSLCVVPSPDPKRLPGQLEDVVCYALSPQRITTLLPMVADEAEEEGAGGTSVNSGELAYDQDVADAGPVTQPDVQKGVDLLKTASDGVHYAAAIAALVCSDSYAHM
jgi:hypothetical protein